MGDRERDDGPPKRDDFKVFVGGLSWQMKEGDLKEGKSALGAVQRAMRAWPEAGGGQER